MFLCFFFPSQGGPGLNLVPPLEKNTRWMTQLRGKLEIGH